MPGSRLITHLAKNLETDLRAAGTPKRATGTKAYLKSPLEFVGADTPTLRRSVKALLATRPNFGREEITALAQVLWKRPIFELKAAAVETLVARAELLAVDDLPMLEDWLRNAKTWALVDGIAPALVGPLFERHPGPVGKILDRWAEDEDFWVRRAALLALLKPLRAGGGDWARFGRYADSMLGEKEFFIRKAIGWILRERSKRRPEEVFGWMLPRVGRMSGLTLQEGAKYLSEVQRWVLGRT